MQPTAGLPWGQGLAILALAAVLLALIGLVPPVSGAQDRNPQDRNPQASPAVINPPLAGDVVLAIHGGAGGLRREETSSEEEAAYAEALSAALDAGYAVLSDGGRSLDAIEAAVRVLEDSALFNAGRGAVFNANAEHQLDASIMDGGTLEAGAVAAVESVRNPISAARLVMEKSPHVMLVGEGADDFAAAQGLEPVTQDYYYTEQAWEAFLKAKGRKEAEATPTARTAPAATTAVAAEHLGTVGAVALDREGDLAAATSTGGLTNKLVGRVGDSPIIGAGTYADNATVAVSATGTGEFFIRLGVARDIAARMEYRGDPVDRATGDAIAEVSDLGGSGAVIALDRQGQLAAPRTTTGLISAYATKDGEYVITLYRD